MEPIRFFVVAGTLLLTVSALAGFAQHRFRDHAGPLARWRAVHVGGTAGAVQLLACSAAWGSLAPVGRWPGWLAVGIVVSTWLLFVGPLLGALGRPRAAAMINRFGAVIALPSYLALPTILI
jgi:hypothetical protein